MENFDGQENEDEETETTVHITLQVGHKFMVTWGVMWTVAD